MDAGKHVLNRIQNQDCSLQLTRLYPILQLLLTFIARKHSAYPSYSLSVRTRPLVNLGSAEISESDALVCYDVISPSSCQRRIEQCEEGAHELSHICIDGHHDMARVRHSRHFVWFSFEAEISGLAWEILLTGSGQISLDCLNLTFRRAPAS